MATDEDWMRLAIGEADLAAREGEVPVGCVLVSASGNELARRHNRREAERDPTAHAEMLAVRQAAHGLSSWRLEGAVMYVTLEPCPMCAGALVSARVARVVYGCDDPKAGALTTLFRIGQDARLNHCFSVTQGVLATDCAARLRAFFEVLRSQGKK